MQIKNLGIVIFESLTKSKTGFELHSCAIKYNLYGKPFLSQYFDIENKSELIKKIKEVIAEAKKNEVLFFLHFEMHGFEGGIQLKNGENVSWIEILPLFTELNIFYKNKLGISLAVCHGASLLKSIDVFGRSPFRYVVTSHLELNEYELAVGFEKFYTQFIKSFSVIKAVEDYNSTITDKANTLYIISSEFCINTFLELQKEEKRKMLDLITNNFESSNDTLSNYIVQTLNEEIEKIFNEIKIDENYYLIMDM